MSNSFKFVHIQLNSVDPSEEFMTWCCHCELLTGCFVVVEVVQAQPASPGYLCWIWNHQLAWFVLVCVCVCELVPCVKRSIRILFINSFCCYGSAFPQASSVRGKLSHSCHITLLLVPVLHTHTHTLRYTHKLHGPIHGGTTRQRARIIQHNN